MMPKQRRNCILSDSHELMKELKDTCEHHLRALTDAAAFEKIVPYNPIAVRATATPTISDRLHHFRST